MPTPIDPTLTTHLEHGARTLNTRITNTTRHAEALLTDTLTAVYQSMTNPEGPATP